MTARSGSFAAIPPAADASRGSRGGSFAALSFVLGSDVAKWKNQCWIASAGAYETWISSPDPNTSPPSGRAGSNFTHVPVVN